MRIEAFLRESPMFTIKRAARRFDAMAAEAFAADNLGFMEGLVLAAIFFEASGSIKPSHLAETFATTRGNVSHAVSSLEAMGFIQRRIDPSDARGYWLSLKPSGRKCALRVIAAFDKMQQKFEREIGRTALTDALAVVRKLESC